jgi:hypothetical protein
MALVLARDLTEITTRNLHGDKARPARKAILTMAPLLIRDRTEMSTRHLHGNKVRIARKANNLSAVCKPIVWKT